MSRASETPPRLPSVIDGKFRVQEALDATPDTVRLLVEHIAIKRQVELHTLAEGVGAKSPAAARLLRAARAMSAISRMGLQSVVDSGTLASGVPYVVYEAVRGVSLRDLIAQNPRGLPVIRSARIVLSALEVLRDLHRAGVAVRGLGPDNIMVLDRGGSDDLVKLCRLERAAFLAEEPPDDEIPWTPYLAPETRRQSIDIVDPRVDVYAAGVMLRHLITGRTQPDRRLPDTAQRAVDRATAEEPDDRFPDAEILMSAVALLVPGESGRPPREEMPTPQDRLVADLHYLSLRRSTRHGTREGSGGDARVQLLPVLLAIEAVYRRLGPDLWARLADEVPAVEDLLPGAGKVSSNIERGVPIDLFAQMLIAADRLKGRGDMGFVTEIGDAVAERGLAKLLPDLPTPHTPAALVAGFPYVWGQITRQGRAQVTEPTRGSARLVIREQTEPSLELTGFVAGLLRGALRTTGATQHEVLVTACEALGDAADVLSVSWSTR